MAATASPAPLRRRDDCVRSAHASSLHTPAEVLERIRTVARTLEAEPGLTSRELAERARLSRRHMSLMLLRLEEHGLVVRDGRRWFVGAETVA